MLPKVLAILGTSMLIFGCQGPQIQKALDALNADADGIGAQITEAKPLLITAADLEKAAAEKLSKKEKEELLPKIDEGLKSIVPITALKAKIAVIKDSLMALEGKATGKIVENITAMRGKLDDLLTEIAAFDAASAKLTAMKAKLVEEEKPTPKTPAKPEPKKAVPPPKKK